MLYNGENRCEGVKSVKENYQKYIDNLTEVHRLTKNNLQLMPSDQQTMLEQLRENSNIIYALSRENDELLHDLLYSRSAEDMTQEDVEDLKEFADALFVFARQNDVGASFQVHQLLYQYAELNDDYDLRVRQLYHMGAAMYYINPLMVELGINLFGNQVTKYFTEGAESIDRLEEIENPETREYVLRCFTNMCLTDERFTCRHQPCTPYDNIAHFPEYERYFDYMMGVYQSPRYRALMPEYDWDKAIYNLHFDRSLFYQFVQRHHPREILDSILESARYIYSHQEQIPAFRYSTKEMRVAQIYATVCWKAGLISTTELADEIYALIERADPDDFSLNGIMLNLQMPLHFEHAYRAMNNAERKAYEEKMTRIEKNTQSYLFRAPRNEFSNQITQSVSESIRYRAQHNLPLQKKFFDALLFCHPPTYIHVRVAAFLSRKIFKRMVEVTPDSLLGIYDIYDVDELRERCEELSVRIYSCALYHDVGKVMLLDHVSNYDRKILDEEYGAIQMHTMIGAALLEKTDPMELSVIARHHHRYYNEMGGYPQICRPCPPQYKPIVDIVTVCDAIEAATDNIGRCYANAKSFADLIEELRTKAGTRYSPDVIAIFDDETFFEEIERELRAEREEIYFETYDASQYRSMQNEQ